MGCCLSTSKSSPSQKTPRILDSKTTAKQSSVSKSPPPTNPLLEEETVKEVLSETPSSVPKQPPAAGPRVHAKAESWFLKSTTSLQDFPRPTPEKEYQNGVVCKKPFIAFGGDDLSDASEICSTHSETVSASTSVTEKRENRDELRELRHRSPAKSKTRSLSGEVNRDRTVGKSPGRRPDPSPNRVRPVSGSSYGRKRESGEGSGRRSRSPVIRSEFVPSKTGARLTQSARNCGKSPGRLASGLGERIRRVDGVDSKWPPPTNNELLENPLVSLECFIFL